MELNLETLNKIDAFLSYHQDRAKEIYNLKWKLVNLKEKYPTEHYFSNIQVIAGCIYLNGYSYKDGGHSSEYEDDVVYVGFEEFIDSDLILIKEENKLKALEEAAKKTDQENQKDLAEFERLKAKFGVDYGLT